MKETLETLKSTRAFPAQLVIGPIPGTAGGTTTALAVMANAESVKDDKTERNFMLEGEDLGELRGWEGVGGENEDRMATRSRNDMHLLFLWSKSLEVPRPQP